MLNPVRFRPTRAALLAPLLVALAACAPRASDPGRATVSTDVRTVSFYPSQTGLTWSFLREGEALNEPTFTLSVEGPTLFGDQPSIAYRLTGRGTDQTSYRQVSDAGVLLLGFTKPGLTVSLTPPWREAPAASDWKAGLTWNGETTVRVFTDGKLATEGKVTYRYTVLERRSVSVAGSRYDVWVVIRQINDSTGGVFPTASQELWFAPNLGEIRTPDGLVQVSRNYKGG